MSTTPAERKQTRIEADPDLPTITITRDFDAPVQDVFRAHCEADLVARWLGPRSTRMDIELYDCRTGGAWRYVARGDADPDAVSASFYGSFHEVRPNERIVQTFTFEDYPDGVSLETLTFEDLGEGRTRIIGKSLVDSLETRDLILASGMEVGVVEGYEELDALLASRE